NLTTNRRCRRGHRRSQTAPTKHPASTLMLTRLFLLYCPHEVSFSVVEVDAGADRRNMRFRHHDLSAGGLDCPYGFIDVVDSNRTFEADHSFAGHWFAAFMHQTQ